MLRLFKWLKRLILALLALLVLSLLVAEGFDRYIATDQGARWYYRSIADSHPIHIHHHANGIRYLTIGDTSLPQLVLVHGAPGGLWDWRPMAQLDLLYTQYHLLIPERPGYGGTQPRQAEPSIRLQSERLLEVVDQGSTLMGHSYGAPVVLTMAALAPKRVSRVVAVSGTYDPDQEQIFGISHWINFPAFQYLLPRNIWVANVEKLSHAAALREVLSYFRQVPQPLLLIHGDVDSLVPYDNTAFLQQLLPRPPTFHTLAGADHPVHMQQPEILLDMLIRWADEPSDALIEKNPAH